MFQPHGQNWKKGLTGKHPPALLKTIVTLRCRNKREIASHIEKYDELWQRLLERSSQATTLSTAPKTNSKDMLEAVLLPLANSNVAEGAFFLTTLPTSLDNVVDNLMTQESANYDDDCSKLPDLYSHESPAEPNTAFTTTNVSRSDKGKRKQDKVYTHCKSMAFRGIGHQVADCRIRKRDTTGGKASAATVIKNGPNLNVYAFAATGDEFPPHSWILDSGASSHMTPDSGCITNSSPTNVKVTIGNGQQLQAIAIGTAEFKALVADGTTHTIRLLNTLVVPDRHFALLSWRRLAEAGASKTGNAQGTPIRLNSKRVLEAIPYAGLDII